MKTLTTPLLLATTLAAFGSAFADDAALITRAQVMAELRAARASGEAAALVGEDSGSAWRAQQTMPSMLLLAQPRAADRDFARALLGEDSGSFAMWEQMSRQMRAQAASTYLAQHMPR